MLCPLPLDEQSESQIPGEEKYHRSCLLVWRETKDFETGTCLFSRITEEKKTTKPFSKPSIEQQDERIWGKSGHSKGKSRRIASHHVVGHFCLNTHRREAEMMSWEHQGCIFSLSCLHMWMVWNRSPDSLSTRHHPKTRSKTHTDADPET